jgi:dTMP kinase
MSSKSPSNSARFLVFEGLDGSGKSTLMNAVDLELRRRGLSMVRTREPGGTPLAEDIRKLLLKTDGETPVAPTELLLYSASRAQHVSNVIKPALARGEWVMCDRFSASTVSFQCFARKLSRPDIDWLNRFAEQSTSPDLYLLLDLTVDESERRQGKRQGAGQAADRMERESREFHEAVRQGYLAQAKENPSGWLVLDAMKSPEEMKDRVIAEFERRKWLV